MDEFLGPSAPLAVHVGHQLHQPAALEELPRPSTLEKLADAVSTALATPIHVLIGIVFAAAVFVWKSLPLFLNAGAGSPPAHAG